LTIPMSMSLFRQKEKLIVLFKVLVSECGVVNVEW
jgi:hypothetical protein